MKLEYIARSLIYKKFEPEKWSDFKEELLKLIPKDLLD